MIMEPLHPQPQVSFYVSFYHMTEFFANLMLLCNHYSALVAAAAAAAAVVGGTTGDSASVPSACSATRMQCLVAPRSASRHRQAITAEAAAAAAAAEHHLRGRSWTTGTSSSLKFT